VRKNVPSKIRSALKTEVQKAGKRSSTTNRRLSNIKWIEKLPRTRLSYQRKERQVLIHTTAIGEKIFIQYPGKESARYTKNNKERKTTSIRPWDFRPELYLPGKRGRYKSMSFFDIWAIIFETAEKLTNKNRERTLRMFAIMLYRMAYMLDHVSLKTFKTQIRDVTYKSNGKINTSLRVVKKLPTLFKYEPNKQALAYIAQKRSQWGDMSLEAFLFYNELLAWNEDCKYYYRNYHIREAEKWIGKTGRVNTLLTHVRILGYILQDVSLASIFSDFSTQRGISPTSNDEVINICKGFIDGA
jgi:hypothetical protein